MGNPVQEPLVNSVVDAPPHRPLKICLAGSGGSHLRQLLDLEPAWGQHDAFFVTEDTGLPRSLAENHRVHFVEHVALGQGRLGAPLRIRLPACVISFSRP